MTSGPTPIAELLRNAEAIVDVRSPLEFAKGAIASARNIPLFSNEERAEIGTLYRWVSRDAAVGKGLAAVESRLDAFVSQFQHLRGKRLLIYCARGGMRSHSVVRLLCDLGFTAEQLPGGYKAFRTHLLYTLEHSLPPRLIVLHGQTGVGKTLLLNRLVNALDLEGAAQHRSSLFGAVNLQPRTQQQFDAHLAAALEQLDPSQSVWVEAESRKIGAVLMPAALRRALEQAPGILVTASLETRVARIVAEYGGDDAGTLAELEAALRCLKEHLGGAQTEALAALVRAGNLAPVVERLLESHYDPRYAHSMRKRRYVLEVSSEDLDHAAAQLREFAAQAGTAVFFNKAAS